MKLRIRPALNKWGDLVWTVEKQIFFLWWRISDYRYKQDAQETVRHLSGKPE